MDWIWLVWIVAISSWLAYINWLARIKKGDNVTEVNPIWAFFDELGFEKIQFIIVPFVFLGLGSFFLLKEMPVQFGTLFGILVFNTIFDLMMLNRLRMCENTTILKNKARTSGEVSVLRWSFGISILQWVYFVVFFIVVAMSFSVLSYVVLGVLGVVSFSMTLKVVVYITLGLAFFGLFIKLAGVNKLLLRGDLPFPSDDGIPRKTSVTKEE